MRRLRLVRGFTTASLGPLSAALGLLLLTAHADGQETTRVSVASSGAEGNGQSGVRSISGNGRIVAFDSDASNLVSGDTNNKTDIFIRDLATGLTERVSVSSSGAQGNSYSYSAVMSSDGKVVAFTSDASNLVSGDTNDSSDAFVHDLTTGLTERVSVSSSGTQGDSASYANALSADGRFVVFSSYAHNLVSG